MRITVVIPALNDAPMLERCLAALAAQSRPADELLVVDNGSTDDTAAVAVAGGARVVSEPHRGIFPATAAGFDAATGELLARLDADSVPHADWLARVEGAFLADPELDAVSGPGDFYGSNRAIHWVAETLYIGGYIWFVGLLLGHDPLFGSNLGLKRDLWLRVRETVHRDRSDIHDDLDLSIHMPSDARVRFDRSLRVGVSARPFASMRGLGRRLSWAFRTLELNRREVSYARRRRERRAVERQRTRERAERAS